jgi:hypothetical protein
VVTDNFELKYLQKKLKVLKEKIQKLPISSDSIYAHVGVIDGYKKKIKHSEWRIVDISDQILEILGDE